MAGDWIKLHRKMLDNPVVMKDPDHLAVWVYLLLGAAWTEHDTVFGGKVILLKPGQIPTGRKKISAETGVEESKVKRILNFFKSNQLIDQQSYRYGSLISIVTWDKYQNDDQQNDQQVTNECPTSDQRVTTTKERKERKEINNNVDDGFDELWNLYPRKSGKQDARKHYRKALKEGVSPDDVRKGIIAYKTYIEKTGTDPQYVKMGSSFFCQRSWEDDWTVQEARAKPKSMVPHQQEPPKYKEFEPVARKDSTPMPEQTKQIYERLGGMFK